MISLRKLTKRFGEQVILDGIDLDFKRAEIVFLLGKSGVGKSVLLKTIVGLLRPDSGEIWVDGEEVSHFSEAQYYRIRKKCGMVFQFPALLDSLTVRENIAFGIRAHQLTQNEDEITRLVKEKLSLVNLGPEILSRFPTELSFGMQKRVSIARTLAVNPDYLLFDEPTTGLDPVATALIDELIRDLSRKLNVTSVVVSHDIRGALKIAHQICFLNQGKIIESGSAEEMRHPKSLLAQEFLFEATHENE